MGPPAARGHWGAMLCGMLCCSAVMPTSLQYRPNLHATAATAPSSPGVQTPYSWEAAACQGTLPLLHQAAVVHPSFQHPVLACVADLPAAVPPLLLHTPLAPPLLLRIAPPLLPVCAPMPPPLTALHPPLRAVPRRRHCMQDTVSECVCREGSNAVSSSQWGCEDDKTRQARRVLDMDRRCHASRTHQLQPTAAQVPGGKTSRGRELAGLLLQMCLCATHNA